MPPEPYYTAIEAAEEVGISCRWIYEALYTGRLKGRQVGRGWRIRPVDLNRFKKQRRRRKPPGPRSQAA